MGWITSIPLCFRSSDLVLGGHDEDRSRTLTMLAETRGTGSTDDDIRATMRDHFTMQEARSAHVQAQMDRLEAFLAAG
jgi:hypothetical protein